MNSAGWIDIWHVAGAMLARQSPFVQILAVTLATLFLVMAIEGFRTSMIAIWRGHRDPTTPVRSGSATAVSKSFLFKPAAIPVVRRKVLTENPRQFRSPRPMIRRHAAPESVIPAARPQHPADISEDVSAAV
jgi:hypothetical protein